MNTTYPSDLSEAEWDCLQRFLPARSPHSRLRRHTLRSVFDALFYLLRTGCPWRYLPSNFPPWQTVYYHWRQFCRTGLWTLLYRVLRDAERRRVGRDPHPTAAIMDTQSVKTVEESGRIRGEFRSHMCQRSQALSVSGYGWRLLLSFYVTLANVHDTFGARCRSFRTANTLCPAWKIIWADQAYQGHNLADGCKSTGDWTLEVVKRTSGTRGWSRAAEALDCRTHIRLVASQPTAGGRRSRAKSKPAKH